MKKSKNRPASSKRCQQSDDKPNPKHLGWYEQWMCEHKSFRRIGDESTPPCSSAAVYKGVKKVKEWLRLELFDRIVEYRERQTECLEQIIYNALKAWEASIGVHTVVTEKTTANGKETTTRTETLCGDPRYLAEARTAMADIREIWGVNKPLKLEVVGDEGSGLDRVCGMSRANAIRRRGELLLARANAIEAKTPVAAEGEPENV